MTTDERYKVAVAARRAAVEALYRAPGAPLTRDQLVDELRANYLAALSVLERAVHQLAPEEASHGEG